MHERMKIYQHVMNGFSYMLPFVVAGGLLIALSSFSFFGNTFPYLHDVGELVLSYTFPILAGWIAFSIADRPGIVAGVAAGGLALIGQSGFMGAILGGFAAGYLMEIIKWMFKKLPRTFNSMKPILIYPLLGVLFTAITMLGINFLISPLSIWLEQEIINIDGIPLLIAAMILGGFMAVDMGGPINKIAYMIGVISIVHDHSSALMAAIMAAGMIPPLAISFALAIFKKDFTDTERKMSKQIAITGLSFITEGAMPFVKTYHKSVHLPLILGSIFAAMICAMFQTAVPAPHGGIFVVFLMTNWWGFLISLLSGTLLSSFLIKMNFILGRKA
jgi:PTS system fructose-specific IIC component